MSTFSLINEYEFEITNGYSWVDATARGNSNVEGDNIEESTTNGKPGGNRQHKNRSREVRQATVPVLLAKPTLR